MVVKESGRKAWLVIPCHQGPQVLGSGGSELCVLGQLILGMLESCPGTSSLRNMPFHHKYVNTSYRLFFVVFFFLFASFCAAPGFPVVSSKRSFPSCYLLKVS